MQDYSSVIPKELDGIGLQTKPDPYEIEVVKQMIQERKINFTFCKFRKFSCLCMQGPLGKRTKLRTAAF